MTFDELLTRTASATDEHVRRVKTAIGLKGEEGLRGELEPGVWSCGQVIDHVVVSNAKYIKTVERVVATCPTAPGSTEVQLSYIGKFLVRVAGPDGDAPVPPPFRPRAAADVPLSILDDWAAQQSKITEFAQLSRGKNLNRKVYGNPVVPLFRMCLADFFMLAIDHTERHVRQIEERAARLP